MIHITLLPGAALLAASVAAAQGAAPERPDPNADITRAQVIERVDQRFARFDANNDGRFTREEGQAMRERRREERAGRVFDRLDADHNGSITREEMNQARAQRQAQRQAGRGQRMAGGPPPGGPDGPPPPGMRGPGGHGGPGMRGHRGMRGARMAMRMFGEQGFITREQFRQHALERFDRADADHNGTLTAAERRAARPGRGMRMRHGPDGPPPPPGGGADGDF